MRKRFRWCCKRKGRGRPSSELLLSIKPIAKKFIPSPKISKEKITLTLPEYEVLILSDLENLTQEEIAIKMGTSRGTVWRLLENARGKVAKALKHGLQITIEC